jgi:hypothetical protein
MRSLSDVRRTTLLVAVLVALLVPHEADAANFVNGNFESGTLGGWQVHQTTGAGNWFAYRGTDAPIGSKRPNPADPVQPPPQGNFAAIADQANPESLILYQDVALEPGRSHQLSLLAYYDSYDPIAIPSPDTLSVDEETLRLPNGQSQKNQQFRIDVIRPEAPLDSLDPADILRTMFVTKPGDPVRMAPRKLTANLSVFAGQTVRLRIATAVTEEVLNSGVDAVSIATSASGRSGARGGRGKPVLFGFGRLAVSRSRGIATLKVRVSGSGLLRAKGASTLGTVEGAGRTRRPQNSIEPVTTPIAVARTVTLRLRPTPALRGILRRKRKRRIEVEVTFMPTEGSPEAASLPVVFKLRATRQR